ncbi:hypothetical protein ABK040_001348 [Willaertia magna]
MKKQQETNTVSNNNTNNKNNTSFQLFFTLPIIFIAIAIAIYSFIVNNFYNIHTNFTTTENNLDNNIDNKHQIIIKKNNMIGKQALCVGGTSGIGKGIALKLAKEKMNVVIMGRNEKVGNEIISEMKELNPNGKFEMIVCDASSMKEISKVCDEFKQKYERLDYLTLSQGMASFEGRKETKEGIDTKLALHYYGRVLFIKKLNDLLRRTANNTTNAGINSGLTNLDNDVRVLTVLTAGVHPAYTNLNDLALKENYSLMNAANAGCFYNDLAMDQFSREEGNENISFIHAAPGFVATNLDRQLPSLLRWASNVVKLFGKTPEQCAENMFKGLSGEAMRRGFHLMNSNGEDITASGKTKEHNDLYREAVWKHTNELLEEALQK